MVVILKIKEKEIIDVGKIIKKKKDIENIKKKLKIRNLHD